MKKVWVDRWLCADLHIGHKNIVNFLKSNGEKLRPFNSIEEHDEALIENWNSVVKPNDKIYVLGDVVINKKYLDVISRLNGKKKLIMGNHDIFDLSLFQKYFYDIKSCKVTKDFIMTHIPIHPSEVKRFKFNVHGHTHDIKLDDPRYICVSMEQIDFKPIHYDEIIKIIRKIDEERP